MVTFWIPGINPIVPTFYQPTQHTEGKQDLFIFLCCKQLRWGKYEVIKVKMAAKMKTGTERSKRTVNCDNIHSSMCHFLSPYIGFRRYSDCKNIHCCRRLQQGFINNIKFSLAIKWILNMVHMSACVGFKRYILIVRILTVAGDCGKVSSTIFNFL